jgi:phosphatidate cytidylyltransferase
MALDNVDMVVKLSNISPLLTRTLSAVAAIILSVMALHFGSPYCDIFAGILTFGMLRELSRMTIGNALHPIIFICFLQMCFIVYEKYIPETLKFPLMFFALLANIWTLAKVKNSSRTIILMIGMVYICISMFMLVKLMHFGGSAVNFIYWLLTLIWINDTAAFLIGKNFGKNKLAPQISPNKTWEGLIGAIFVGTAGATMLAYAFKVDSIFAAFVAPIAFILSISSHVGDLIESFIKRLCEVKDTGNIMPGHGGILDRLDSLLFVNIVVAICALLGFLRFNS